MADASVPAENKDSLNGFLFALAAYPHFPYYRQEGFARLNPPAV